MQQRSKHQPAHVVAVVSIANATHAAPIAEALLAGGVRHIEVTLRTAQALEAIEAIAKQVPEMEVGAGTVLDAKQCDAAIAAGASFIFSPGFSSEVAHASKAQDMQYIPGIATASEAQQAILHDCQQVKVFPAEVIGGSKLLRALHGPFPQLQFCPTGGINLDNMTQYTKLPYVFAVGGSWLVTPDIMQRQAWKEITTLSQQALAQA